MKAKLFALALMLTGCTAATEPATTPAAPPEVATRAPAELLTKDSVDYSCRTSVDCEVKDVGNCCGYYPACVNKDSPTFPEQGKADCAKDGMSSICGFPSISSCDCVEGRCAAINGPSTDPGLPLQ